MTQARRALNVAALVLSGVAFVAIPGIPSLCPCVRLYHVPCPSCGMTRATLSVLHGDLAAATRFHPLWWAVLPFLGALFALEAWSYVRTGAYGQWMGHRVTVRVAAVLAAMLLVVWGARALGAFGGPVPVD